VNEAARVHQQAERPLSASRASVFSVEVIGNKNITKVSSYTAAYLSVPAGRPFSGANSVNFILMRR
jgi:hypothetical protein